MDIEELKKSLDKLANPAQAKILQGFFKTGIGEYGEGDIFLGISMPAQRKNAKNYAGLNLSKIKELLESDIHEHRMAAIIILVEKYQKANDEEKANIANFYLKNAKRINNWDLVDVSAPKILGDFLLDKDKKVLYDFAKSKNLWEKRIAIISTFGFIRKEKFYDALSISEILLNDSHDLIHKAVGWMLREIGNRDIDVEEEFLKKYYKTMPRTMLRYAIEKFDEEKRLGYLKGTIDI